MNPILFCSIVILKLQAKYQGSSILQKLRICHIIVKITT